MLKLSERKPVDQRSKTEQTLLDYYSNPQNADTSLSDVGIPVKKVKAGQIGMYINIMYMPDPDDYSSIEASVDNKLREYNCVQGYVAQEGYKAYICIAYSDDYESLVYNEKRIAENVRKLCGCGSKVYILTKTRDGLRLEKSAETD